MAYSADRKPLELTALTSLATDDTFVVGDTSDVSEVAKSITKADLITDLSTNFAAALGADDNYVTDAEKVKLSNLSGANSGDQTSIVGITGTKAQFDTACSDGNFLYVGDVTGISDGDKGDITVSASGTTWTIDNGAVSLAKQADMATASVVYRKTAGSGAPEVQTLATLKTDLGLTGTNSGDQTSIVGITGTIAQFNTAVTDAELARTDAANTFTGTQTITQIDLGNTDTSITRSAAGIIAVEGVNLLRTSDVDDTPVNGATTDPVSSNWAFDHAALASSDTVVGHIEVATTAETNTGTDATRAVSPDSLAGSYAGTKSVSIQVYDGATDVATGDGKAYITIPEALNGMNLIRAQATVVTAGTTNATTVMIHNKTDAQDMLSGAISIASAGTVGTVGTINTSFDDVATNDVLRIDVDSISTTAPKGLQIVLEFRLP